jgi:hypothetical protein
MMRLCCGAKTTLTNATSSTFSVHIHGDFGLRCRSLVALSPVSYTKRQIEQDIRSESRLVMLPPFQFGDLHPAKLQLTAPADPYSADLRPS